MRMFVAILAFALALQPALADVPHGNDAKPHAHAPDGKAGAHAPDAKPHQPDILEWKWDTAVWTCVVFVLLFFILSQYAWGPILVGLEAREKSINDVMEEAKRLREENAKETAKFRAELQEAYAKIPTMMEEARRDVAAMKDQTLAEGKAEVQKERQRLLRELDIARDQALQDIWNQSANVATLIATKAIGRSLTDDDHRRLVDEAVDELKQKAN